MTDLTKARTELETALGEDGTKMYFENLKLWFKVRISKEEFDANARKLFPARQVHLHNNFLLALLNKCHLGDTMPEESPAVAAAPQMREKIARIKSQSQAPGRKRKQRPPSPFALRYEPADAASFANSPARGTPPPGGDPAPPAGSATAGPNPDEGGALLVERRRVLPDKRLVHGRMYLAAWQAGLDGVHDTAVEVVMVAVQQCLKNVLSAVLSRKSGYRVRSGRMLHGIGTGAPNPWLRNGAALSQLDSEASVGADATGEEAERRLVQRLACGDQRVHPRCDVSVWHVWDALQAHAGVIPCHLVYSQLQERVSARLHHPSNEELEQEQVSAQIASLKQRLTEGTLVA